jgi:hypothetical protein
MIYGIKQIEKQFPGFEARWTGGHVFDMRNIFSGKDVEDIQNEAEQIHKDYPDLIVPPADKMYIVAGRLLPDDEYTFMFECAAEFVKNDENDLMAEVIGVEYLTKIQGYVAFRGGFILKKDGTLLLPNHDSTYFKSAVNAMMGATKAEKVKEEHMPMLMDNYDNVMRLCLSVVVTSLLYLNVKNINKKNKYVSQMRDFYYPKAWGREYKVLSLSQTIMERSPGPDLPPGYHVRGHFQRGHFKRKKTGVYWWNPHWRGDFSKGIVMKDYKVKASAGPTA